MNTSGTGLTGGAPGGIPDYLLHDDKNAAEVVLKTVIGMVSNLDTVVFTQVGTNTKWKYDTSASRPTLMPLGLMRTDGSSSKVDDSWKQIQAEILDDFPTNVRAAYEQSLRLPPEERNPALVALGRVLEGAAKTISWMNQSVTGLNAANPVVEARMEINQGLSNRAMNGVIGQAADNFNSLEQGLLSIGANNPYFDELMGGINQLGAVYSALRNQDGRSG